MTILEQVLESNQKFVEQYADKYLKECEDNVSKIPNRRLAIFTCMDTRLVDFLEPAMGIKRGEAKVIKNAGNTITGPFEATIRSMLVAIFELGVNEIMVIGHLDCGIAHSTSEELINKMRQRGIPEAAINMVESELETWLDQFHHPVDNIKKVVGKIRKNPLIPGDVPVHGLIFNPRTGAIETVVNGYSEVK